MALPCNEGTTQHITAESVLHILTMAFSPLFQFFFILNVAVGGTNGYFPDGWTNANGPKPWSNESPTAHKDFWLAKNDWYPTWNPDQNDGEDAALKINYIRVWKDGPDMDGPVMNPVETGASARNSHTISLQSLVLLSIIIFAYIS